MARDENPGQETRDQAGDAFDDNHGPGGTSGQQPESHRPGDDPQEDAPDHPAEHEHCAVEPGIILVEQMDAGPPHHEEQDQQRQGQQQAGLDLLLDQTFRLRLTAGGRDAGEKIGAHRREDEPGQAACDREGRLVVAGGFETQLADQHQADGVGRQLRQQPDRHEGPA